MGKLILCTGKISETPFCFSFMKQRVYSIDELCYYIYENLRIISIEDFTEKLAIWIREFLGMDALSIKLLSMIRSRESLKSMIVTVLCSADYYEELEIKALIREIDLLERIGTTERKKQKADYLLEHKRYIQAERMYQELLPELEGKKDSGHITGNIWHNIGLIKIHTSSYEEAIRYFQMAYERNQDPNSKLATYFLFSQGKRELLPQEVNLDGRKLLAQIEQTMEKAKELKTYKELEEMESLKKEGKVELYYEKLEHIILNWKEEYKNGLV